MTLDLLLHTAVACYRHFPHSHLTL
jgi:hypothetical protein